MKSSPRNKEHITMKARTALTAVAAATLMLGAAACGSSSGGSSAGSAASSSPMASSASPSTSTDANMAGLVGPGCGDYAKAVPSGSGSVDGMAADPVATAASNNPLLKTLVASVSGQLNPKVNLVNTLNNGQFTVFAPIDSAFAKVPAATLQKVTLDPTTLRKVLSHLVVRGQLTPSQASGSHLTLAGDTLAVTSASGQLAVGAAQVVCGGLRTANATIYLIDAVPSLRG
jgi:uncharacterized surface protein with fasciclin (FAS1) repeats